MLIRLKQILLNLISNAVKFTDAGFVKLSVSGKEVVDNHSKIDLVFSVKDTGMGIAADDQERIFAAFEQQKNQDHAKYGGTGLGLFIVERVIREHGGNIAVSSSEGEGTVFTIKLPLQTRRTRRIEAPILDEEKGKKS